MAAITCEATACRYNARRRCTLTHIRVGPGVTPVAPAIIGATAASYDGQLRAGYAQEFEAYVAFAEELAPEFRPGAACLSFAPR
jgi:ferredoxin-NADP reductase